MKQDILHKLRFIIKIDSDLIGTRIIIHRYTLVLLWRITEESVTVALLAVRHLPRRWI